MAVQPALRLLLVSDDDLFSEYVTAAMKRCSDLTLTRVRTPAEAQTHLCGHPVDCIVIDDETAALSSERFREEIRDRWPTLPVVLAADCPRAALPSSLSVHAFLRKGEPIRGCANLPEVVRVVSTVGRADDSAAVSPT